MSEEITRDAILKDLRDLAFGKSNDAARLAFFQKEDAGKISKMDLRLVDGIHTTSGGVDVKLVDRAKLIELLLAATEPKPGPAEGAGDLLAALNGAAGRLEPEDEGAVDPLADP